MCINVNGSLIAFLDLLGFSNCVRRESSQAIQTLRNIRSVIDMHGQNEEAQTRRELIYLQQLHDRYSLTSFQNVNSISDSIFYLGTEQSNPNQFIEQISAFLCSCFQWQHSEQWGSITSTERYPCLFRCGVSIGEVLTYQALDINRNSPDAYTERTNFCGNAVVEAVRLEEVAQGQGANLLMSNKVVNLLDENHQRLTESFTNNGQQFQRFLWPAYYIIEEHNIDTQKIQAKQFLIMTIHYYLKFRGTNFRDRYIDLIAMTLSAFRIVLRDNPEFNESEWFEEIITFLQSEHIPITEVQDIINTVDFP